jgi:2-amino-4-hydroxy-6-hydroxymethyldihydropteridine diphosphokinase
MPKVYLGLGSNVHPEANLRLAIRELTRRFQLDAVSDVYRNAAVGFEGDDFLNAVACIETDLPPGDICRQLEEIHEMAGRKRGEDSFVARSLDIDLLLYGDQVIGEWRVPRQDVLDYAFVLRPLAELAPDLVHPVTGKTMAGHWAAFDHDSHALEPVAGIL